MVKGDGNLTALGEHGVGKYFTAGFLRSVDTSKVDAVDIALTGMVLRVLITSFCYSFAVDLLLLLF